ncbi:hypothetical protein VTN00DRAFT_4512 [Thermoascus crustaceus]|uniref:uncharacterized protein n=1 Tax=Thermoascus crustaceus TaxID=5088 RepID=UPI003743DB1B
MAAQAALIADTIVGLKRALRRENDYSGPDEPITQPTNRGNKLRANAKHVHEGALGFTNPQELYKEKIEHAGYTRYILQRNPPRYDSEGDELEEDDVDSEADAAAAEENPFSEIALEQLLCPLKHPSELPTHPSMSEPYRSKALRTMTKSIEHKLHQERILLWRARNLHRQFLGDCRWMPCGMVETPEDRFIFEPRRVNGGHISPASRHGQSKMASPSTAGLSRNNKEAVQESPSGKVPQNEPEAPQDEGQAQRAAEDVEMIDAPKDGDKADEDMNEDDAKKLKSENVGVTVEDLPPHSENGGPEARPDGAEPSNGAADKARPPQPHEAAKSEEKQEVGETIREGSTVTASNLEYKTEDQPNDEQDNDTEMHDGSSPEPPRRMTTRAQANASHPQQGHDVSSQPSSPSAETANSIPPAHPLFLVPDSIRPDVNFGLPPNEAEETRRLLWSYIQKQEETVRGFEHMLESLLRACRMKDDVFEWCKAEGHVGEMSDGEDWYDREKWGLAEGEDLKKGADEDEAEVDEGRTTKRGRGRRQ